MTCATPLGYAIGLLIVAGLAFWLGRRWEREPLLELAEERDPDRLDAIAREALRPRNIGPLHRDCSASWRRAAVAAVIRAALKPKPRIKKRPKSEDERAAEFVLNAGKDRE